MPGDSLRSIYERTQRRAQERRQAQRTSEGAALFFRPTATAKQVALMVSDGAGGFKRAFVLGLDRLDDDTLIVL